MLSIVCLQVVLSNHPQLSKETISHSMYHQIPLADLPEEASSQGHILLELQVDIPKDPSSSLPTKPR
jgi:hypothetical protein